MLKERFQLGKEFVFLNLRDGFWKNEKGVIALKDVEVS